VKKDTSEYLKEQENKKRQKSEEKKLIFGVLSEQIE